VLPLWRGTRRRAAVHPTSGGCSCTVSHAPHRWQAWARDRGTRHWTNARGYRHFRTVPHCPSSLGRRVVLVSLHLAGDHSLSAVGDGEMLHDNGRGESNPREMPRYDSAPRGALSPSQSAECARQCATARSRPQAADLRQSAAAYGLRCEILQRSHPGSEACSACQHRHKDQRHTIPGDRDHV
jgi:hypothetical protein